jgi:hypothetical protein
MKRIVSLILISVAIATISCDRVKEVSSINPVNWQKRAVHFTLPDSLISGKTYLSVYSQIYSQTEHRTYNLTATISMRNTSISDTIFLSKAEYFDSHGHSIRTYFSYPIFLRPMETVEIVIDELDKAGGTGANFIFDWQVQPNSSHPLFEAVMISSAGQGMSFKTDGKQIR